MANKTEVANLALTLLGATNISDFEDDNSETARKINAVYSMLLKSMLRSHPWSFAKKETSLSQIDTDPVLTDDFTYIYNLPSDCIKVLKTDQQPTYAHKIKGRKIYSNASTLKIEYIYYNDDPSTYDDSFIDAFAARLAAELAYPITGDLDVQKVKWQEFESKNRIAKSMNGQEVTPDEPQEDEFLNARL